MPPSSLVTYRNRLDDEALKRSQRNSDWSQGPVLAATLGFCQHVFLLGQRYMPSYWSEQFLLPWHTGKGTLVNNVVPTLEGSQSFRHDDSLERSTKLRPQLVGQLVSAMWQSRAQRRVWKGHAMPMTWDQAPLSHTWESFRSQVWPVCWDLEGHPPNRGKGQNLRQYRFPDRQCFMHERGDLSPNQTVEAGRWMSEAISIPKGNLIPDVATDVNEPSSSFVSFIPCSQHFRREVLPFLYKSVPSEKLNVPNVTKSVGESDVNHTEYQHSSHPLPLFSSLPFKQPKNVRVVRDVRGWVTSQR